MPGSQDPIAPTTLANVARGAWDGVSQNNPLFAEVKRAGSVEYDVQGGSDGSTLNSSSYELSGSIEAGRYAPITSAPGMDISAQYVARTRFKRWTSSFGEITSGTIFDRGAFRRNQGSQLVDLSKTEIPAVIRDTIVANGGLAWNILQNNSTVYSGTGLPIHGLPTLLPGNGAYYNSSNTLTTYAMSVAIADYDLEGYTPPTGTGNGTLTGSAPADTDKEVAIGGSPTYQNYLGLSMKRGAITGVDNLEFDAWSPTLVNSSYTSWTGTNDDEANAVEKFLQYAVFRGSRFSGSDRTKMPNIGFLDRTFFEYLGARKSARETIFISPDKKDTNVPDTGYPVRAIPHAGIMWYWDENMPSETAYCFNTSQMKLKVQPLFKGLMTGNPLKVSGEDAGILETALVQDEIRRQWLFNATFPGQLICCPRYFVRVSNYS